MLYQWSISFSLSQFFVWKAVGRNLLWTIYSYIRIFSNKITQPRFAFYEWGENRKSWIKGSNSGSFLVNERYPSPRTGLILILVWRNVWLSDHLSILFSFIFQSLTSNSLGILIFLYFPILLVFLFFLTFQSSWYPYFPWISNPLGILIFLYFPILLVIVFSLTSKSSWCSYFPLLSNPLGILFSHNVPILLVFLFCLIFHSSWYSFSPDVPILLVFLFSFTFQSSWYSYFPYKVSVPL